MYLHNQKREQNHEIPIYRIKRQNNQVGQRR